MLIVMVFWQLVQYIPPYKPLSLLNSLSVSSFSLFSSNLKFILSIILTEVPVWESFVRVCIILNGLRACGWPVRSLQSHTHTHTHTHTQTLMLKHAVSLLTGLRAAKFILWTPFEGICVCLCYVYTKFYLKECCSWSKEFGAVLCSHLCTWEREKERERET